MPFSNGSTAVSGPKAGAKEATASSRSNASQLSRTASYGTPSASAWTAATLRTMSPRGLRTTKPSAWSCAARRGRTRNVTSSPASAMRPPK